MKKVAIGMAVLALCAGMAMAHTYSCGDKDPNCTKNNCSVSIKSKCNMCITCDTLSKGEKESANNGNYSKAQSFQDTQKYLNCKPTN
ncbi:MAG: hypothetical protein K2M50_01125 [Treponemataceae bacterium]|nr:hypothetical protein [Treponemataceae bacterium]